MAICKVSLLYCILPTSLLVISCTTTQTIELITNANSPQWHIHQKALQKLRTYQIRGSIIYLSDTKKIYAHFFWQQYSSEHYCLQLINPFGNTELTLHILQNRVQLVDRQGKSYTGDNAEEMIYRISGMVVPLRNLRQWILGLPGESNNFTLDNHYHLSKLTYKKDLENWTVEYKQYSRAIAPTLPNELELTHCNQRIKLKINNWTFK
ncbi:lipoprotein insertase outer membrane protein LolB [Candidatus Gillettellia adelgis]